MFPLPIVNYVKIGCIALLLLGCFAFGWNSRNNDYMAYKKIVKTAEKEQEIKVASITKQQELVTKGVSSEYDAKLSLIRSYYSSGVRQPNGSKPMSSISTTSSIADGTASYNKLVEQCAETTQQLVSLQEWLNEQIGVMNGK